MLKNYKKSFFTIILSTALCCIFFTSIFFLSISILNNSSTINLSMYDITFGKSITVFNRTQALKGNIILLNLLIIPILIILLELSQKLFIKSQKLRSIIIMALSSIYIIEFALIKGSFSKILDKLPLDNMTSNGMILNFIKTNLTVNISSNSLYYIVFVINILIIIICLTNLKPNIK